MLGRQPEEKRDESLSQMAGELGNLTDFTSWLEISARHSEILFKLTTEIEDTTNALREAERLVERLKKHLKQLRELHRTLTK